MTLPVEETERKASRYPWAYGVTDVYTLINTYWGLSGPNSDASLVFTGSAGATYTVHLGSSDIRNWLLSSPINGTSTVNVFSESSNGFNGGAGVLDMQKIILPSEFATQTLNTISTCRRRRDRRSADHT